MFDRECGTDLQTENLCAPEDIGLPVPRVLALVNIYTTMDAMTHETTYYHDMTPIYNYTEADIPDWDAVLGDRNVLTAEKGWPAEMQSEAVIYLDGELNFGYKDWLYDVGDGTEGYHIGMNKDPGDYNYDVVAKNNPQMRPYAVFTPSLVLGAYNIGLTEGVDANHTCNPTANVTRAELCTMLYRVGIDHVYDWTAPY